MFTISSQVCQVLMFANLVSAPSPSPAPVVPLVSTIIPLSMPLGIAIVVKWYHRMATEVLRGANIGNYIVTTRVLVWRTGRHLLSLHSHWSGSDSF